MITSSFYSHSHSRGTRSKKKTPPTILACFRQVHSGDLLSNSKRALLLAGVSLFPFVRLKARALDGFTASIPEGIVSAKAEGSQVNESPFLYLLNEIGIIGIGVLGALYALAQQEKNATEMTIESMTTKLLEKEASIMSLQKTMEETLMNEQEKWRILLNQSKEEQSSVFNQLNSAKGSIAVLSNELKNANVSLDGLKKQINSLLAALTKSREGKSLLEQQLQEKVKAVESLQDKMIALEAKIKQKENDIQRLRSSVSDKESQLGMEKASKVKIKEELERQLEEDAKTVESLQQKVCLLEADLKLNEDDKKRLSSSFSEQIDGLNSSHAQMKVELEQQLQEKVKAVDSLQDRIILLDAELKLKEEDAIVTEELKQNLHEKVEAFEALQNEMMVLEAGLKLKEEDMQRLNCSLSEKDEELSILNQSLSQMKGKLDEAHSSIGNLADELMESNNNLESTRSLANELNSALASLQAEKTENYERFKALEVENHNLKASYERTAALSANQLEKSTNELQAVNEKLQHALAHINAQEVTIFDLRKALETSEKMLEGETICVKNLQEELLNAQSSLDEIRTEASYFQNQYDATRSSYRDLEHENKKLQIEISTSKQAFDESLEKEKQDKEALAMDLRLLREQMVDALDVKVELLENELTTAKDDVVKLKSEMSVLHSNVNNKFEQAVQLS